MRDQEIVDRPILTARGRDADLADQDRIADALDALHQGGVDIKCVLVEHKVGFEILDLGQQDPFGLGIELRT